MFPLSLPLPDRRFMQFCWVVPDLDQAIDSWARTSGVGPFFLAHVTRWENPVYRGKRIGGWNFSAALAQAGDVQIELVCQHDDEPTIFREIVPFGKTGFHHTCIYSDDFDRDIDFYKRQGFDVVFSGEMMGYRVCWIDTSATLGFMVEVLTANPAADAVFETIRAGAANWDGKDPVRSLG